MLIIEVWFEVIFYTIISYNLYLMLFWSCPESHLRFCSVGWQSWSCESVPCGTLHQDWTGSPPTPPEGLLRTNSHRSVQNIERQKYTIFNIVLIKVSYKGKAFIHLLTFSTISEEVYWSYPSCSHRVWFWLIGECCRRGVLESGRRYPLPCGPAAERGPAQPWQWS